MFDDIIPGVGGDSKPNLNSVIEDATIQVAKDLGATIVEEEKKEETKEPEAKPEPKKEDEPEKKDEPKEDLTEEQIAFSKTLYKALNNPDASIRNKTLEILATAAGLKIGEVETKKEIVEAKQTLVDLLKEGLGEFDFLAEKLGPVIEKAIKLQVEEETKETKASLNEIKLNTIKEKALADIDFAFNKYANANEVANEVKALQDVIPPNSKVSTRDYFDNLIILAAAKKGITLTKAGEKTIQRDKEKVEKNRNDVGKRLTSERDSEVSKAIKIPGKMNLNEAINAAIESMASETK